MLWLWGLSIGGAGRLVLLTVAARTFGFDGVAVDCGLSGKLGAVQSYEGVGSAHPSSGKLDGT